MIEYKFEFEEVSEREKEYIIALWNARTPIKELFRRLPYKHSISVKIIEKMLSMGLISERLSKGESTRRKVVALYESGITDAYTIAKELNVSTGTARNYLKSSGLPHLKRRPKHNYKRRPQTKQTKQILKYRQQNMSYGQIAKKMGVSRQYVGLVVKREKEYDEYYANINNK